MAEDVVLFAPVGPYMDALTQLIWALYRQRNQAVKEVHLVVDARGRRYLDGDLLGPQGALERLRRKVGKDILDAQGVQVYEARVRGSLIRDDANTEERRALLDTLWQGAKEALKAAGERRLIFGLLAGGRSRTVIALQAAMFQLLARERDQLLDVRVSDARVQGYGDLFFPEQDEAVEIESVTIAPRDVEVIIIDVEIPRLGALLGSEALHDYTSAMEASQRAIDASRVPALRVDLVSGHVEVDGEDLGLSTAELAWFGYLAGRRGSGEGWVAVGQESHEDFRRFLARLSDRAWVQGIRTKPLLALMAGEYVSDEDLRNLRGKTVQKIKRWCEARGRGLERHLVPLSDGGRHQRIPLAPEHIVLEQ